MDKNCYFNPYCTKECCFGNTAKFLSDMKGSFIYPCDGDRILIYSWPEKIKNIELVVMNTGEISFGIEVFINTEEFKGYIRHHIAKGKTLNIETEVNEIYLISYISTDVYRNNNRIKAYYKTLKGNYIIKDI